MFKNRKFKCHRSVLHHFVASYDHFQWIYIGLNFDNFQFQKINFLPLWLTKFQSGYLFGYYSVCFLETHLSNSFHSKMLQVTRHLFSISLFLWIFAKLLILHYITFWRGILTTKIFSESKSMKSGLSNAVSNVPVALFNAEIS